MLRPQSIINTLILRPKPVSPNRSMLDHATSPSSASRIKSSHAENALPTLPKRELSDLPLREDGQLLPAHGKFMSLGRAHSTPPQLTNDSRFRSLSRGTVGDLPDASSLGKSWSKLHLSKKRSQYYSETFAIRETNNPAKERVARDSVVVAEVKMNCCVSERHSVISASDKSAARIRTELPHRPVVPTV